jgi:glyoxylase-like metal-dependent hydrolase (beta-lactamase superfamily II)
MKTILFLNLGVTLLLTPLASRAQRDFSDVTIKTIPVAGNIYMLEGAGGNIGLSVGPDGVLMVDDQFAPLANKISAAIEKLGHGPVKFLLNTHYHGDHTGGNAHFGSTAHIIAHHNVRKRLQSKSDTPKTALPVVTFDQKLSIHLNGEEVRVIHLGPGHTDGDSIVHFNQSGVVHLGDLFFNERFPYVDLDGGGDVALLIQHIQSILEKWPSNTKFIPGHGSLASHADLKKYHQMLKETTGIVREATAAGKTLKQIQASGLPENWKDWGSGFISQDRWIQIVHTSYSSK